jgi:HK97 family phage portal protein
MARFPFFQRKSTPVATATPTFFSSSFVEAYITQGLNANQQKFLELYLTVPELQAILNYKARVFAGMNVIVEDNPDRITPQIEIIRQPNPLQNQKEFLTQYYVLRAIFGNEFIHPVVGVDKANVAAMWNLPPMNAEVIPVNNSKIVFNMTNLNEIIEKYKFQWDGSEITYKPDEIIHFNDNQVVFDKDKLRLGDSKLRPLVQACENIKHAYEARGILISQSPRGILSNKTTDGIGRLELGPNEKQEIQEEMRKAYGTVRSKWDVIITNSDLDWTSMAGDVSKMKLFEEVEDDFQAIANAYNFPPEVLKEGSKYENKNQALIQLYQEAIIPEANEFLQGLSNWMGITETLKADFSHIAVLQADLERRAKSLNWAATGLSKALETGITTTQEATEEFKKYMS